VILMRVRLILILGFLALAGIGLFPPRRITQNQYRDPSIASRVFLLAPGLDVYRFAPDASAPAEVDVGRLLAEVVAVLAITGALTLLVAPWRLPADSSSP
jgi:hypothetical protein